jgi:hypothetical protein
VGAPHLRKRLWILAYRQDEGLAWWERIKGDDAGVGQEWQDRRSRSNDTDGCMVNADNNGRIAAEESGGVTERGDGSAPRQDTASELERSGVEWEAMADSQSAGLGRQYKSEFQSEAQRSGEELSNAT